MASIYQSIELLSKEKGIDTQIVLDAVKDALLVAARKHYRTNEEYIAELNEKTGSIDLFAVKKVVENVENPATQLTLDEARRIDPNVELEGEIRIAKPTDLLGRISAQTAKQVIFQKVREAERETIFHEYSGRVGELVNCTVKRAEGADLVMDLGKTEARLPKKEQSRLESFSVGDRVRCVIKVVDKSSKNPGVVVSRAAPELVMRLFEQEVPEIYDSTIIIKGCAREAGERTKIAVHSRDRDVDSVGACVGMKGMRVQSIIRELRGEKIDIIEFSEDPVVFATHALSPAKITRVAIVDPVEKHMEVIVDDSQLSLAIGKKGQNVRLAAKLLNWRIDIKSEEEKRQEVETAMAALVIPGAPVSVLIDYGLGEKLTEKLIESGVGTVEKLGTMTPEQLEEIPGIGPKMVEKIQQSVNQYYAQFEAGGEASAGAPAAVSEASEAVAEESDVVEEAAGAVEEVGAEPVEEASEVMEEVGAETVEEASEVMEEAGAEAEPAPAAIEELAPVETPESEAAVDAASGPASAEEAPPEGQTGAEWKWDVVDSEALDSGSMKDEEQPPQEQGESDKQ